MKININTQEGTNQITTEKIKGELKAVVFSFEKSDTTKFRIIIESELGYTLLDYADLDESIYLPLSTRMINNNAHLVNQWDPYYLDEKLKITVDGPTNKDLQIFLQVR